MSLTHPNNDFGNVSCYEVPGIPWVTSSIAGGITTYNFPYVASSFLVKNTGSGSMSIAFTRNGFANSHYLPIAGSEYFAADTRIKTLHLSGPIGLTYTLFATLTPIAARWMPILTGSATVVTGSGILYWDGVG